MITTANVRGNRFDLMVKLKMVVEWRSLLTQIILFPCYFAAAQRFWRSQSTDARLRASTDSSRADYIL
jgi:hypothetical protein